jgi:hypothetical protein
MENVNMERMSTWSFSDFIEEIILLSEITEVPGVEQARSRLLLEVWRRYPSECQAMGLTDGLR